MDASHLSDALKHVAVELEQLAQERKPTEADLQVALGRKLQAAAAESGKSVVVSEQERLSLDGWPGVGPVDLTIRLGEDSVAAAFVELKWGGGTLWNCVWDVAKLALAVRQGAARSGYLVAGAPTSEWEKPVRGAELFESRVRDIGDYMAV